MAHANNKMKEFAQKTDVPTVLKSMGNQRFVTSNLHESVRYIYFEFYLLKESGAYDIKRDSGMLNLIKTLFVNLKTTYKPKFTIDLFKTDHRGILMKYLNELKDEGYGHPVNLLIAIINYYNNYINGGSRSKDYSNKIFNIIHPPNNLPQCVKNVLNIDVPSAIPAAAAPANDLLQGVLDMEVPQNIPNKGRQVPKQTTRQAIALSGGRRRKNKGKHTKKTKKDKSKKSKKRKY